jgi:hypothetical protein
MPTYTQGSSTQLTKMRREELRLLEKAKTGTPQLGFVLDQSASMNTLVNEALAAFNTLVDEQRNVKCADGQEFAASLALFNDIVRLLYNGLPLGEVEPLTRDQYKPSGGTALNDAIGSMIQAIGKRVGRSTRVLVAL